MKKRKFLAQILAFYLILGTWKGYLALFEGDAPEPRQIFPRQIQALPEEDRQALEEGILIRNQRRLEALLEDYLS